MQFFAGNPRGWTAAAGDPAEDDAFRAGCAQDRIAAYVHAPYLVNFGSPSAVTLARSIDATRHALARGRVLGVRGVVVHAGSAVDSTHRDAALRQLREHLMPLLDELDRDDPGGSLRLLVEPTAGGGQALAATVEQLGPWYAALSAHPRLGVCLDTCHAWAAGHDLAAPGGVRRTLDALVATVGRGRLGLVHANDSRDPLGSGRDRHARIGAGLIGVEPFAELFRHSATRGVPLIVETPGGPAEHAVDIATLIALRDR